MLNGTTEMDRLLGERISKNPSMLGAYNKSANSKLCFYDGYIVHTNANNHLKNRYNVKVPDLYNETLTDLPVMVPGGDVSANGVGYKRALTAGAPVVVAFMHGSPARSFIMGGAHLPGTLAKYERNETPGTDEVDEKTGNALYPSPNPDFVVKGGGEAVHWTFPLNVRTGSPVHGAETGIGAEVAGTSVIYDYQGNNVNITVGKKFDIELNLGVTNTEGFRKSLANLPLEKSLSLIKAVKRLTKQSDERYYVLSDGKYVAKSDHPSKARKPPNSEGTQAFNEVKKYISKIESVSAILGKAGILSNSQMSFLQNTVFKNARSLENIWGVVDEIGLDKKSEAEDSGSDVDSQTSKSQTDFGDLLDFALDGPIDLPFEIGPIPSAAIDLGTDIARQFLKKSTTGGGEETDSEKSIITGEGAGAPTPLSTEGKLVLGGRRKSEDVIGFLNDKVLPVYRVVSQELNNLDIVNSGVEKMAGKLFNLGIKQAPRIIKSINRLRNSKSIFAAIDAARTLVPQVYNVAMTLGQVRLGRNKDEAINDLENSIDKPSVRRCPLLPPTLYNAFDSAEAEDDEALAEFFTDILYLDPIDFTQWAVNPDELVNWLRSNNLSAADAMEELLAGRIFDFMVNVVNGQTGVTNFGLFKRDIRQLRAYNRRCFELGVLGTENLYGSDR